LDPPGFHWSVQIPLEALVKSLTDTVYFVGGTFPINLPYLADPTLNTTALITSNTKPFPPPGSKFNVSMSQQGFSAVASCQYQQLDAESDPPLERFVNSVEVNSDGGVTTYTAVSVTTTCTNGQIVQYGVSTIIYTPIPALL
jgi:hypothetical protein